MRKTGKHKITQNERKIKGEIHSQPERTPQPILSLHIPAYKLGGKIYLKLEEIEKALKPIGARAGEGVSQNNKGGTK